MHCITFSQRKPFLYHWEKKTKDRLGVKKTKLYACVCVYSNSRNDVPRVAQRYGIIAAHTWRRASVLVVFVVFWRANAQFCRFDKADATADVQ